MVTWWWLIISFFVGAFFGIFVAAIIVANALDKE